MRQTFWNEDIGLFPSIRLTEDTTLYAAWARIYEAEDQVKSLVKQRKSIFLKPILLVKDMSVT